jgi:hypothetical protein
VARQPRPDDHDEGSIGTVLELYHEDERMFGGSKWLVARCRIDNPPSWLRRGTPASINSSPLFSREMGGFELFRDALLNEVSILSPGTRPAEPHAQVLFLREVVDPWGAPPPTLSELGPLTEKNALAHWDARMELGEDPDAAFRDIERKLARRNYDPRLGRVWDRTNVRSPAAEVIHHGRDEILRRTFPTKITIR